MNDDLQFANPAEEKQDVPSDTESRRKSRQVQVKIPLDHEAMENAEGSGDGSGSTLENGEGSASAPTDDELTEQEQLDQPIIDFVEDPLPVHIEEERLGDSEKYGVFFRMVRMGVPPMAVKIKMTSKGFDPAVLDLGEDYSMTRVLAMEKAFEAQKLEAAKPAKRGEIIHWEAVPVDRIEGLITVFGGDGFNVDNSNLDEYKEIFDLFVKKEEVEAELKPDDPDGFIASSGSATGTRTKRAITKGIIKSEKAESVLDPRRAQSVSICMKKLRIHPEHPAKFTWALREMNEKTLDKDTIEVLLSTSLWPLNEEEEKKLRDKAASGAKMAEPDKLILFVVETVPDVVSRVNALAFRWEFESSLNETAKAATLIKQACRSVLRNENLKLVVRIAVMIGNKVNEDSGIQIKGCTLNSLIKLGHQKTVVDRTITVLDCVVTYCAKAYPDVLKTDDLQQQIANVRKVELDTNLKTLQDMRQGVDTLRKIKQMENFSVEALKRLDRVQDDLNLARMLFSECLSYFGMDTDTLDTDAFFSLLSTFMEAWLKALAKREKDVKAKKTAALAELAALKAAETLAARKIKNEQNEQAKIEQADEAKSSFNFRGQLKTMMSSVRRPSVMMKSGAAGLLKPISPQNRSPLTSQRKIDEEKEIVAIQRANRKKSIFARVVGPTIVSGPNATSAIRSRKSIFGAFSGSPSGDGAHAGGFRASQETSIHGKSGRSSGYPTTREGSGGEKRATLSNSSRRVTNSSKRAGEGGGGSGLLMSGHSEAIMEEDERDVFDSRLPGIMGKPGSVAGTTAPKVRASAAPSRHKLAVNTGGGQGSIPEARRSPSAALSSLAAKFRPSMLAGTGGINTVDAAKHSPTGAAAVAPKPRRSIFSR